MSKTKPQQVRDKDPLASAFAVLEQGDHVRARTLLGEKSIDPDLSDKDRATASYFERATRIDPAQWKIGLSVLGLYAAAIAITAWLQPG